MPTPNVHEEPSSKDFHLIEEAIRRLQRAPEGVTVDRETLVSALANEIRRGRRDLFSLIRAGRRILDGR